MASNTSGNPTEAPNRTSDRFNAPDADVTFKSSDGVLFSIHRKYIEANTGAFPGPEFETNDEIVGLDEKAETLELMFAFIYPSRHPDLAGTSFEVLAPLAEAAEKYEVFSAMNICHIRMINFLPNHADAIMSYAAKHGYKEVVDKAAPLVVAQPIGNAVRLLPQSLVVPWMIYRQQWLDILHDSFTGLGSGRSMYCDNCGRRSAQNIFKQLTLGNLVNNLTAITTEAKTTGGCSYCTNDLKSWATEMERKTSEIQNFSAFFSVL